MKTLIIYDSLYGNTEKVANAVENALAGEVGLNTAGKVKLSDLKSVDLLIVGSPVHGGKPTPAITEFLNNIPANSLTNVSIAAFDTRFAPEDHGFGLRMLMKVIGFAADRMAKTLTQKGGVLLLKPEGFIVDKKEGPLKKGELTRAQTWSKKISEIMQKKR